MTKLFCDRVSIINMNMHIRDYVLSPEKADEVIFDKFFEVENDNFDNYDPPSAA